MEIYLEKMKEIADLREKTYKIFYAYHSIDLSLNFSYNYKNDFYINDEEGLVSILKFGGCGTIPLMKTNRKEHPLNRNLIMAGFYLN